MATVISTVHTAADNAMTYSFTFPYLSDADVKVTLAGVPETHFTVSGSAITWHNDNYIPPNGTEIVIYRETNVSALVTTWTGKTYLDPESLDLQAKQSLYALQEIESGSDEIAINALDSRVTTLEGADNATTAYVDAADQASYVLLSSEINTSATATLASAKAYSDSLDHSGGGGGGGGFSGVDSYTLHLGYTGERDGDITVQNGTWFNGFYTANRADGYSFLSSNARNNQGVTVTLDASDVKLTFSASGTYELTYECPYSILPIANSQLAFSWYVGSDSEPVGSSGSGLQIDNCPTTYTDWPGAQGGTAPNMALKSRATPGRCRFTINHTNAAENFIQLYIHSGQSLASQSVMATTADWSLVTHVTRVA